ncbi:MAG: hypothetical protein SX243_03820 [Acidobacteriota bacterium]|nr:hypothetical protein [Acidobacteriota bacterium]
MKKLFPLVLFTLAVLALAVTPAWAAKQTICHFPPGNPANFHTITVGDKAVDAHVANHGDLVGSCLANCEAICDDGNACTIDVEPNPDQCVCAAEPRDEVDCDDGNQCTADACDATNGTCLNDPGPLNGATCDDDDGATTGEACYEGSCDPPCPCFDGADIVASGPVAACGSNFPGFPNLTGMIWLAGGQACSGELCVGGPGTLTCAIASPAAGMYSQPVTPQEDANCRALLLNYCDNPNFTEGLTSEESRAPFIGE